MLKTHDCGRVDAGAVGQRVTLGGWVNAHRDHGGVLFVDLRDRSGVVQVVFEGDDVAERAHRLRDEWCINVTGTVRRRPTGTENPKLPTGEVEVVAEELDVLSEAPPLPFQLGEDVETEETTRLRYRYLDLRRPQMLANLETRARVVRLMHDYLDEHGFIEVETPLLAASTPEGARDFLVPSRLQRGNFYALVQSPQIFKQILMIAGVERYYQIARCLRDEDLRADRQPEHTQLDLEMSFVERDDVMNLVEGIMWLVWRECLDVELSLPLPRMPYAEAMDRFGTDRPDLRAGPAIADLSAVFSGTEFKAFAGVLERGGVVRGLRVPGYGADASRAKLDALIDRAKELGAKGLVWMVAEPEELRAPVAKFLSSLELEAIRTGLAAEPGDLVLLAADEPQLASEVLGTLRLELASEQGRIRTASDPPEWHMLWVVDFPMFEWNADEDRWEAMHNPFSAPSPDTEDLMESDPASCRSLQYDLVGNGVELGGGSIRNHRPEAQMRSFAVQGIDEVAAKEKFGFFLEALRYGAPPHGGIGMGLDRIVRVIVGAQSIRDVIAFPKTQSGSDLMTGAPGPVDPRQLRELGIRVVGEEKR